MNSTNEPKPLIFVEQAEEEQLSRSVLGWLNTQWLDELPAEDKPPGVGLIDYEALKDDTPCMALSTIQGAYIVQKHIVGGHKAEYQFKVIYRLKPGGSPNKRLKADELLNRLGVWASRNRPDLSPLRVIRVEPATQSSLFAMYENGDEDHQILMKLTYEVI